MCITHQVTKPSIAGGKHCSLPPLNEALNIPRARARGMRMYVYVHVCACMRVCVWCVCVYKGVDKGGGWGGFSPPHFSCKN